MPGTGEFKGMCYFRHALALDERRAKFQPDYVSGGSSYPLGPDDPAPEGKAGLRVKEMWFIGGHSDMSVASHYSSNVKVTRLFSGGGNKPNLELKDGKIPLQWMVQEAKLAGLRLKESLEAQELTQRYLRHLETPPNSTQIKGLWNALELLPFKHFTYKDPTSKTWYVHVDIVTVSPFF